MKRKPYNELPIIPTIIAETVCATEYKMQEWSTRFHSQDKIEQIEALRKQMTTDQIHEFANLASAWCRQAYAIKAKWFEKIAKAKSNRGRDQLYVWITHWLQAYLISPETLRRNVVRENGKSQTPMIAIPYS